MPSTQLKKSRIPIKAVIMVPTYRAAAKFIEKTRDLFPGMIYTSVSFVGSTALANELMQLGKRFATGVIVTQVVPALEGHSSLVLDYKAALAKYFPGEQPDYVSLEGYVAANVLITALRRNGPDLDTEKLVQTLENLRDLDIGLRNTRELRSIRAPGRAQGLGYTDSTRMGAINPLTCSKRRYFRLQNRTTTTGAGNAPVVCFSAIKILRRGNQPFAGGNDPAVAPAHD